jgi:hypothetical protein
MQESQQLPAGPLPDCTAVTFDNPPQQFAYTTTTATAIKGSLQLAVTGEPFSCNDFATPGTGGMLAAPAPTTDATFGDSANVFRLGEAMIERVFYVDPGILLAPPSGPDSTGTGLFTSALGGANAAMAFSPGPLTLVMGPTGGDGVASLQLKDDVDLSIDIVDSTCLCLRLLKDEQGDGTIDCDGGTAYDTQAVRTSGMAGFGWTATTGLGAPSGPGNANLLVMGLFERVMVTCFEADCPNHVYSSPANLFAFTTTAATAVQETTTDPITLAIGGQPFDCANFANPGSGGQLAAPAPTTIDPVGEVANIFRFAEAP